MDRKQVEMGYKRKQIVQEISLQNMEVQVTQMSLFLRPGKGWSPVISRKECPTLTWLIWKLLSGNVELSRSTQGTLTQCRNLSVPAPRNGAVRSWYVDEARLGLGRALFYVAIVRRFAILLWKLQPSLTWLMWCFLYLLGSHDRIPAVHETHQKSWKSQKLCNVCLATRARAGKLYFCLFHDIFHRQTIVPGWLQGLLDQLLLLCIYSSIVAAEFRQVTAMRRPTDTISPLARWKDNVGDVLSLTKKRCVRHRRLW